ncbi:uncharacterized protein LOC111137043 [Crassostrea virginica]
MLDNLSMFVWLSIPVMKWTVYVGIFWVQFLLVSGIQCPSSCSCTETTADCSHKRLNKVPENIPTSTERLYLGYNQLEGIKKNDFCDLPNLIELQLQNNKIVSISPLAFSGTCLPKIQIIRLENNRINSTVAGTFFNLSSLRNVTLTNNNLTDLSSDTFMGTPVVFLHLGGNDIRNIPTLNNMDYLQDLILEGNKISNCTFPSEFMNFTHLKRIVLSNNKIRILTKDAFLHLKPSSIRILELARNNITKISNESFLLLTSLQSLKLGRNPLTDSELSNGLSGLLTAPINSLSIPSLRFNGFLPNNSFRVLENMNLSTLDISFNEFYNLPSQGIQKLTKLKSLDLSNCEIRSIDENAFDGLKILNNLLLSNNYIGRIPVKLPKLLMYLYMTGNQVEILNNNTFANLTSLKRLHLGNNKILTLFQGAFAGLNNLEELELHGNRINTLPKRLFSPFSNLVTLTLQQNRLRMIQNSTMTFSSMTSLKYLNLSDNGCSYVPISLFSNLKSLLELYLKGNKLGKYLLNNAEGKLFSGLRTLKILDLSSNQIHTFSSLLFSDMRSLEKLNLEDNWIPGLESNIFSHSKSLQTLDLSSNMISILNEESMKGLDSVNVINFMNNPFACTCDLRWFRRWMVETKTVLLNVKKYKCYSPPNWKGKSLLSFDETRIECNLVPITVTIGIISGVVLMSTVLLVVVLRYRLYIIHSWYSMKRFIRRHLTWKNNGYNEIIPMDYDACIVHSQSPEDYEWIKTYFLPDFDVGTDDDNYHGQYQIYFDERDTLGNTDRLQTMMEVMEKSRKIIIVVSKHLKAFKLSDILIKETISLKGKSLSDVIIIVVGDISLAEIPRVLHSMFKFGEHVEWKDKDLYKRVFKEKMDEKLQKNDTPLE